MPKSTLTLHLTVPEHNPAGRPVPARLVISNSSDAPIRLGTTPYNGTLNLVVFDQHWNLIVPNAVAKAHIAQGHTEVAPGESITIELADLAYASATAYYAFTLAPGVFYAMAIYHPGTDPIPDHSDYPLRIASDVVKFTVN